MSLSERIKRDGQAAAQAPAAELGSSLRTALAFLEQWPICVSTGTVSDGKSSVGPFEVVAHTLSGNRDEARPAIIAADACAAVIDAVPKLNIEELGRCHRRIATAKMLEKGKVPKVGAVHISTTTQGIIYAQTTDLPFENLVAELERLNASVPLDGWVDALLVGSTGILSYAVQYPGDSKIMGGSLPPGRGRVGCPPPIFIVPVIRHGAADALNRLAFLLAGQLAFFSPGYRPPLPAEVMGRGATTSFLRRGAYSFALDGELRAMPAEQLFAQYLPRRAFHIVQGAKTLGSIDLLPWQDGGVVMLRGPFPLEALLALLEVSQEGGRRVTRRPGDLQLSQVLPLQHDGFVSLLKRFEQRSNMRVTIVEPTFEKRLVSNEGTSSPYVARLFLGLLHLRGSAIQDEHKTNEFDAIFHGLTTAVTDLRDAARALTETWSSLQSSVANGVGVRMEGTTLQVEHLADRDLNRICADFLRAAVNVIKVSLQELAKCLGTDIGFWFKKEEAFLAGVEALAKDDPGLAAYLVAARCSWSEQVVDRRNAVDHHSWRLPLATYQRTEGQIEVIAPEIEGEPVLSYVDRQLNRICCAVEEITAHLLANLLPEGLTLHETPVENRDENSPIRFELTLETGGKTIWALHHHSRPFLES